jgi:hypothetical protein
MYFQSSNAGVILKKLLISGENVSIRMQNLAIGVIFKKLEISGEYRSLKKW